MLFCISAVSANVFDFLGGNSGEKMITIESEDSSLSGKLQITEYKSYESNNKFEGGGTNDILVKNGKGEYKLHDDTKFFEVDGYLENIEYKNSSNKEPQVTVKYLLDNKTLLSSSNNALNNTCDVSFGYKVYSVEGEAVNK